ncbi:MAG: bactofilin family protein [Bacillota bacterium]
MLFGSDDKKDKNKTKTKEVSTIISQGTTIEGEVHVKESIRVDGKLEGKLIVDGNILIGQNGKLNADLEGQNIEIAGEVEGDVKAEGKLKLLESGKLNGDIRYSNLIINDGALFKGTSISASKNNNNKETTAQKSKKNKKSKKK